MELLDFIHYNFFPTFFAHYALIMPDAKEYILFSKWCHQNKYPVLLEEVTWKYYANSIIVTFFGSLISSTYIHVAQHAHFRPHIGYTIVMQ